MAVERREFPRAPLEHFARLELPGGVSISARTIDISRAGVQLETNRSDRDLIFPEGQPVTPASRPKVTIQFTLPTADAASATDAEMTFEAEGEAVLFRRLGADRFRLGIGFLRFPEGAFRHLEAFVYRHAAAARRSEATGADRPVKPLLKPLRADPPQRSG